MSRPSPSITEHGAPYERNYDGDIVTDQDSEYEIDSELTHQAEPQQQEWQPQAQRADRRQKQFQPGRYRSSETDSHAIEPRNRPRAKRISTVGPLVQKQGTSTEELTLYEGDENQQLQKKDEDSGLKLRLDLNLDVEVELKAKIHGDLTLSLLSVSYYFLIFFQSEPL